MSKRNAGSPIVVGSRKSELALIQTKYVISRMEALYPNEKFKISTMSTVGDRVLNVSLPKIGEKSLFTKDLEDALSNGLVDFVVHSLKDLPTSLPNGMVIGAVLSREEPGDVLVLNEKYKNCKLDTLPSGCVIGTSSLRRTAQLRRSYPQLEVCDIRGNLNTRLAKLDAPNSKYAGIVLARAGLIRMGWKNRISQILEPDDIMYAVGQGALAVECRGDDTRILRMLEKLVCLPTTFQILSERSFLKKLGGGCSAPVAVKTSLMTDSNADSNKNLTLELFGGVWSLDGKVELKETSKCCINIKHDMNNKEASRQEQKCPFKRMKIDNTSGDNGNVGPDVNKNEFQGVNELSNIQEDQIHDITVIHSDVVQKCPFYSGKAETVTENKPMKDIIEVHGDLLQRCPFYSKHMENAEDSKHGKCPLQLPIGQDFMGQCPYIFDLNAKVETPVDHFESSSRPKDEVDKSVAKGICPMQLSGKEGSSSAIPHENLKDCNANANDLEQNENKVEDEKGLYCGLYCHTCVSPDIFDQCRKLGEELANKLIEIGALKVMSRAQSEIRGTL